jgi:hypothetical protein
VRARALDEPREVTPAGALRAATLQLELHVRFETAAEALERGAEVCFEFALENLERRGVGTRDLFMESLERPMEGRAVKRCRRAAILDGRADVTIIPAPLAFGERAER